MPITSATIISLCQSASGISPMRTFWESRLASEQSMRCMSCVLDISREKNATDFFSLMATLEAMFRVKAVLPMLGRAATRIKSEGCKPEVSLSRSVNSVGMPVRPPLDS